MTELLISVRNAEEARLVAGTRLVRIIDIKEPRHGALGRANSKTLQNIFTTIDKSACLSVALGELKHLCSQNLHLDRELSHRIQYAKIGLAGEAGNPDWRDLWKQQFAHLPRSVGRVAVAYVDYHSCGAPSVKEVVGASREIGCQAVLLDTFDKTNGCLFDFVSEAELMTILSEIRGLNMKSVVAGSINIDCLSQAVRCNPDLVGVRGAVCRRGRTDAIDEDLLLEFVNRLRTLRESYCQRLISNSY